jgi:hypothetical protein
MTQAQSYVSSRCHEFLLEEEVGSIRSELRRVRGR